MYSVKVEPQFKIDYKITMRKYPHLKKEFENVVQGLMESGKVSAEYSPHILDNVGGNYNGYMEFHLSDGQVDVLVLYMPHRTNPVIRLVRMGSHNELFRGSLK